jgi:hypothetical protein
MGLRRKSWKNCCWLSDMIRLFAAFWFVPLFYQAHNNGEGMLLSELTNLHHVLCLSLWAPARLFLLMLLLWSVRIHRLVKGCCGLLPLWVRQLQSSCFCQCTIWWNPWIFSILQTRAKYFSRVGFLAMHSISICLATTLESVQRMHLWIPMTLNLRSPIRIASYSAMLLVHLSVSLLNCNLAT